MIINAKRLFWISLGVGWFFDLLFWGKAVGVSFPLFVFAVVGVGMWAAWKEGVKPHRNSVWLLLPIIFFAVMSAVRMEPMTSFLDRTMALFFMAILAVSFEGGQWPLYRMRDHFLRIAGLAAAVLTRWTKLLARRDGEEEGGRARWLETILRVLLAALPVFFIFGGLLASADVVFADFFEAVLEALQIEHLMEYIQHGMLIVLVAAAVFGVFWQALASSKDEELPGERIKWVRFVGFTEASAALGMAMLLFAVFVGIQFRYFFFGQENIRVNGFTYAEYARRGFFELVVVAGFSLMLLFLLSTFAKRETDKRQKAFSWLGAVLVILVLVILASAFQRLTLYEQAYGFTRLRTYSHVFMIWLGLLLAATAILEAIDRSDRFALALLLTAVGFGASLNVLNVDAFISRANIAHAFEFEVEEINMGAGRYGRRSPAEVLDLSYLASLSPDAAPALWELYEAASQEGDTLRAEMAAGALGCQAHRRKNYAQAGPWQSFHSSPWLAGDLWGQGPAAEENSAFEVQFDEEGAAFVMVWGEAITCR